MVFDIATLRKTSSKWKPGKLAVSVASNFSHSFRGSKKKQRIDMGTVGTSTVGPCMMFQ